MKKLFFLLLFPFISFGQIIPDYEIMDSGKVMQMETKTPDTLFFYEIYNFYSLPTERYSEIDLSPSWSKYFLPRIMCGRHYFSGVEEILPKASIWDQDGYLTMSENNFLNLDHMGYYTQKDLIKIYFLPNVNNILFYKYINDDGEMEYFELEVFYAFDKWQVFAKKANKEANWILNDSRIVLPTWHKETTVNN